MEASPQRRTDRRVRPHPHSEKPDFEGNLRLDSTINDVTLTKQRSNQQVGKR